ATSARPDGSPLPPPPTTRSPPGDELGRIDQAPVNIFEPLAEIADGAQIMSADLGLFRRGWPGEDAEVEGVHCGVLVGRRGKDLAQDGPGPRLGPVLDHRA